MSFQVKRKVDLSDLGDGWQDAFLLVRSVGFSEISALQKLGNSDNTDEESIKFLGEIVKSHLIGGKGFDGENLIDITSDNILELPPEVINRAVEEITGTAKVDPKLLAASKTLSSETSTETPKPDTTLPNTSSEVNLN